MRNKNPKTIVVHREGYGYEDTLELLKELIEEQAKKSYIVSISHDIMPSRHSTVLFFGSLIMVVIDIK